MLKFVGELFSTEPESDGEDSISLSEADFGEDWCGAPPENNIDKQSLALLRNRNSLPDISVDFLISYSTRLDSHHPEDRSGETLVVAIAERLEAAGISTYYGLKCEAGDNWKIEWFGRVREAKTVGVLLSPAYFDSKACVAELIAVLKKSQFEGKIIPIIVGNGVIEAMASDFATPGRDENARKLARGFVRETLTFNWLPRAGVFGDDFDSNCEALIKRLTDITSTDEIVRPNQTGSTMDSSPVINGRNVPGLSPYFAGRDDELQNIANAFKTCKVVAITAFGGVGKTQLMLKYAQSHQSKFPGGVYWVVATDESHLADELATIAIELGMTNVDSSNLESAAEAAFKALCKLTFGSWLLCIDNADDRGDANVCRESVVERLSVLTAKFKHKQGDPGRILVTSRYGSPWAWSTLGVNIEGGSLIRLNVLRLKAAAEVMFRLRHGLTVADVCEKAIAEKLNDIGGTERGALADLVGDSHAYSLGGLPLALQQAAAYCSRKETSFAQYLRDFIEHHQRHTTSEVLSDAPRQNGIDPIQAQTKRRVHKTWALNVSELSIGGRQILNAIALCAPDAIPVEILRNLAGDKFDQLVTEELVNWSMLLNKTDIGSFSVHRMLRFFVVEAMDEKDFFIAASRVRSALSKVVEDQRAGWDYNYHNLRKPKRERTFEVGLVPHVLSVLSCGSSEAVSQCIGDLAHFAAREKLVQCSVHDAMTLAKRSWRCRRFPKVNEETDNRRIAQAALLLGRIYVRKAEYSKARKHFEKSLEHSELCHGSQKCVAHSDISATLYEIGTVLHHQGEYKSAMERYTQCFDMEMQLYSQNSFYFCFASTLYNYHAGNYAKCTGDYAKAEELYKESIMMARRSRSLGSECPDITVILSRVLYQIGNVLYFRGEYRCAMERHEECLKLQFDAYGVNADHMYIAATLDRMGNNLKNQGKFEAAMQKYATSLEMKYRLFGSTAIHPTIAGSLQKIGNVLKCLGQYDSAELKLTESLQMMRQVYGDASHPEIATILHHLGNAFKCTKKFDKAQKTYCESLTMSKACHGERAAHPCISVTLYQIGNVHFCQEEYPDALHKYRESLEMQRRVYGTSADHPYIAATLDRIGKVFMKCSDFKNAMVYCMESIGMYYRIHAGDNSHPAITRALRTFWAVFEPQGDINCSKLKTLYYAHVCSQFPGQAMEQSQIVDVADALYAIGKWSQLTLENDVSLLTGEEFGGCFNDCRLLHVRRHRQAPTTSLDHKQIRELSVKFIQDSLETKFRLANERDVDNTLTWEGAVTRCFAPDV